MKLKVPLQSRNINLAPAFLNYPPSIHPIPCKSGYPLLQTKLATLSDGTLEHDHLGDPSPLPEEAFEVARTGPPDRTQVGIGK